MAEGFGAADAAIVGAMELSMFSFITFLNVLFGGFLRKFRRRQGTIYFESSAGGWQNIIGGGRRVAKFVFGKSGGYYLD